MLKNMVQTINEKDEYLRNMRSAIDMVFRGGAADKHNQPVKREAESDADASSSDEVLSTVNRRRADAKKTEAQKSAEMKSLQAFIIECEKRKILTK